MGSLDRIDIQWYHRAGLALHVLPTESSSRRWILSQSNIEEDRLRGWFLVHYGTDSIVSNTR